jgi:hypothetical protein
MRLWAHKPFISPHDFFGSHFFFVRFQYGAREGYAPPSPATQFMMSPQSGLTYNYAYGFSPRRPASHTKLTNGAISEEDNDARNDVSEASEPVTPARAQTKHRQSPDKTADAAVDIA